LRNFWGKKKEEILKNIEGLLGKLDDEVSYQQLIILIALLLLRIG
jgi:hypothetical protein